MTLTSRLDPSLLYLVLGAAILLGVLGAVLAAPDRSVLQAGLFVVLCSPIALFLMLTALRVRFTSVIDRDRNALRIRERGYLGTWERQYTLDEVGSVYLLELPPAQRIGGARGYLLCLAVPEGAYLLAESPSPAALAGVGQDLARYLGVPFDRASEVVVTAGGRRRLLVGVLLYAAPVTVAVALLGVLLPDTRSPWALPATLTAILLSQVGAILALLYYRQRAADLPDGAPLVLPPRGGAGGLPLAESDRTP